MKVQLARWLPLVVVLQGIFTVQSCYEAGLRDDFVERCVATQDEDACEVLLEERHSLCYASALKYSGKGARQSGCERKVHLDKYFTCMDTHSDEWRDQQAARRQRRNQGINRKRPEI